MRFLTKICKYLFGKLDVQINKDGIKVSNKYVAFEIEEMPNGRCYPVYNGQYLYWWPTGRYYSLQDRSGGAKHGKNKEECYLIMDKYMELHCGNGTVIEVAEDQTIEHLPSLEFFYPKYKDKYLYKQFSSGLYSLEDSISFSIYEKTEEGARETLAEYLKLKDIKSQITKA